MSKLWIAALVATALIAPAFADIRHNLTASYTYALPAHATRSWLAALATGGTGDNPPRMISVQVKVAF
jgi:hypothetical protein